jgi:hypothetical protein
LAVSKSPEHLILRAIVPDKKDAFVKVIAGFEAVTNRMATAGVFRITGEVVILDKPF